MIFLLPYYDNKADFKGIRGVVLVVDFSSTLNLYPELKIILDYYCFISCVFFNNLL